MLKRICFHSRTFFALSLKISIKEESFKPQFKSKIKMVWVIKTACTQFTLNNTTARCCWPCLLGTTALHSVEQNISVEVGFSKCFRVVQGAVFLFAILYQKLQDYCAQGAVKSLPTPRATETTGIRLSYQRNTHWPASMLNNKESMHTHTHSRKNWDLSSLDFLLLT